nr:response regulator transcription factor [Geoanaerobacter pelophilus]
MIIEDEQELAELLAFNLRNEGYETLIANDGKNGYETAIREKPSLILLDLMLPELNGIDVCKLVKKHHDTSRIPVIMLTARNEEIDRVVGFEVGADDYMVKPFSNRELLLRIKAILRRSATGAPENDTDEAIEIGPICIDPGRHRVKVNDEVIVLTTTEFKLLLTLAERKERMLSREFLLRTVWGYNHTSDTRTVDTHITRLRNKLGDAGELVKTVRGFGYKLEFQ